MNRSILITGATGRIGRVLTRHFLKAGDTVIAVGRSSTQLSVVSSQFEKTGGNLLTVCADLMAEDAMTVIQEQLGAMGCLPDCLVNNARNLAFLRTAEDGTVSRQDFSDEFALDVIVPYQLAVSLANAPGSRLRSVVNIGSQYGVVAPNLRLYSDPTRQSPLHYGVAKAALNHLSKELAVRFASRAIRVNCVAFGGVEGRVDDTFKTKYAELCPTGRMLNEDDLAGPVDFLLSDSASAVTGHTLSADCGWSLW